MKNLTHFIIYSIFSCIIFMGGVISTIVVNNKYPIDIDMASKKVEYSTNKNVESRGSMLYHFSFFLTIIHNSINKSILILK